MTSPTAGAPAKPVLYHILCGGRPSRDAERLIAAVMDRWRVCAIATPQGTKFIDADRLAALTGYPVRSEYKHPDEPDVLPPPDAIVVAPATFNTINKWAAGISDTLALGILCEAVGQRLPIVAAPFPNVTLAQHPAFPRSVETLRSWGVRVVWSDDMYPQPRPRTGSPAAQMFDWGRVLNAVSEIGLGRSGSLP